MVRIIPVMSIVAVLLSSPDPVAAQQADLIHFVQPVALDSGPLGNPGAAPAVVFSQQVVVPGAPWVRVVFDQVKLEGASEIHVWSHGDGEVQILNSETIAQWQHTSAYFNGSGLTFELIAAAGTAQNELRVTHVLHGGPQQGAGRTVCQTVDNRVSSNDARTARLLFVRLPVQGCQDNMPCLPQTGGICSGSIIDRALDDNPNDRVMISAGHCFDTATNGLVAVAQFEPIPLSGTDCSIRHPGIAKQFAINPARYRSENLGPATGHDWAAFTCFENTNTTRTPYEELVVSGGTPFVRAAAAPAAGAAVTKHGYGVQGPRDTSSPYCVCVSGNSFAILNTTQQRSMGTSVGPVGVNQVLNHNAQTCGGDSGCPVTNAGGEVVAIHVGGGCGGPGAPPQNVATSILAPWVVAGINAVAASAVPQNDECINALTVGINPLNPLAPIVIPFSTISATSRGPAQAACGPNVAIDKDIWFRYTASSASTLFSLCGSTFDTKIAVYADMCPNAANTALMCGDDNTRCGTSTRSELTFGSTNGTTYLIRIGGHNNQAGTGTLTIHPAGQPANDNCANAFGIGVGTRSFNTAGATTDGPGENLCNGNGSDQVSNDIWYGFVPATRGTYTIETCTGTDFDTRLAAYRGGCPAVPNTAIVCDDDACSPRSRISFVVEQAGVGVIHHVRVGGFTDKYGSGVLTVAFTPSNNDCANAIAATVGSTVFDTTGATTDGPGPCNAEQDVWFTFTAPAVGLFAVDTCGTSAAQAFDTRLCIYTAPAANPCANLTLLGSGDNECDQLSRAIVDLAMNERVYIRLGGALARFGRGILTIAGPQGVPFNDDCVGALTVVDGTNSFSTVGSMPSATTPSCFIGPNKDVWFAYTAAGNANSSVVVDTCANASFDTKLVAYAGTCAALGAELGPCNDDACPMQRSRINIPTSAGPPPYLIRLGGINEETGTGTLTIRHLLNDRCTLAGLLPQVRDGTTPFDTTGAASDVDPVPLAAPCTGSIVRGIYFVYFATHTGTTRFSLCGSSYDTQIAVYQAGSCNPLLPPFVPLPPQVGCNDNNAACGGTGLGSQVDVATAANQPYIIHVGGSDVAAPGVDNGPGVLTITPMTVGPANNGCGGAFQAVLNSPNLFDTTNATTDGLPDAGCNFFGQNDIANDVWYTFRPTVTGNYTIDVCQATFDTKLAVYSTCPPTGAATQAPIACNDDFAACGVRSRLTLAVTGLTVNTLHYIRVGAYPTAAPSTGTGTLFIRRDGAAPPNNTCANYVEVFDGATPFDTTGATTDGPVGAGNCEVRQDVWYQYTASCNGTVRVSTCGANFDSFLAVYNVAGGTCPVPAHAQCIDDDGPACGGRQASVDFVATAGTRYTIRLGGFGTEVGQGFLQITCTVPPPVMGACCCGSTCTNVANAGLCVSPGGGIAVAFVANGNCNPFSITTPCCRADFSRSGSISVQDIFDFLAAFFSTNIGIKTCADFNGTPPNAANVSSQDIFDFLAAFFRPGGCNP